MLAGSLMNIGSRVFRGTLKTEAKMLKRCKRDCIHTSYVYTSIHTHIHVCALCNAHYPSKLLFNRNPGIALRDQG